MCIAALKRKGKGSDVEEADMEGVVHAHNSEYQTSSCPRLLIGNDIGARHSSAMPKMTSFSGTYTSSPVWTIAASSVRVLLVSLHAIASLPETIVTLQL